MLSIFFHVFRVRARLNSINSERSRVGVLRDDKVESEILFRCLNAQPANKLEIKCDWNKWFLFSFSSHLVGSSSYGRDVMFEFIFGFEIYVACDRSERLYAMMMDKWTVNILTTTDEFPLVVSSLSSFLLGSLFIGGDYINRCWFIDFNISNNKHSFKIFPPRPCWPCSPLVVWFFSPSPILFHFTFSCCSKLLLLFYFVFVDWLSRVFPSHSTHCSNSQPRYILYRRPICV